MPKLNLSRFRNKHFLVLAGNGILSIVGFATSFLLFHSLSITDVGIWFFIQGWVAMCEAGRYGFLATATITFYAGADDKRAAIVLGSVWTLAIALCGLVLLANAIAWQFLPYVHNVELALFIKWIGLTFLSSLLYDVIFWRLQAQERYNTMLWFRMLNSLSSILTFVLLIALHKMTLENALLFNLLTNFLTGFVGLFFNLAGIKTIVHRSKECIVEVAHFGKYTLGSSLCSSLMGNTDTFMINFMVGPAAVGVYNLAMRLIAFVEMPLRAFATTGMSQMAVAFNTKNMQQVTYILKKYAGMLTVGFIPMTILCCLFANVLIGLLGGNKYAGTDAANAYRLIMILALSYPIDRFNGITLDVIHKTQVNFYKVILMLIVKITGGFICMSILRNVYGIILSNYLTTLSALIFGYYQLRRYVPYTIGSILTTGYIEMKIFMRKNLKLKPTIK